MNFLYKNFGVDSFLANKPLQCFQSENDVMQTIHSLVEETYNEIQTLSNSDSFTAKCLMNEHYPIALPCFSSEQIQSFNIQEELCKHVREFQNVITKDKAETLLHDLNNPTQDIPAMFAKVQEATSSADYHPLRFASLLSFSKISLCNRIVKSQHAIKANNNNHAIKKLIMLCVRIKQMESYMKIQLESLQTTKLDNNVVQYVLLPYVICKH